MIDSTFTSDPTATVAILARLLEAQRLENDLLDDQNQRMSGLLAKLSHQLRGPLSTVIGFGELVLEEKAGPLTTTQRDYLDDVMASARRLHGIIDHLLDQPALDTGPGG